MINDFLNCYLSNSDQTNNMNPTKLEKTISLAFASGEAKEVVVLVLEHIIDRAGTLMALEKEAIEDEVTLLMNTILLRDAKINAETARRHTEAIQLSNPVSP